MKKEVLIVLLILFNFKSGSSSFSNYSLEPLCHYYMDEKYKFISNLDTIRLITNKNVSRDIIENEVMFFYKNDKLHVIVKDNNIFLFEVVKEISKTDSIKLNVLYEKMKNPENLKTKDKKSILKFHLKGKIAFVHKFMTKQEYVYNVDFNEFLKEIQDMEKLFHESVFELKSNINYYSFSLKFSNCEKHWYTSIIDPKEYILKVFLSKIYH